jgi:hypothetical protein
MAALHVPAVVWPCNAAAGMSAARSRQRATVLPAPSRGATTRRAVCTRTSAAAAAAPAVDVTAWNKTQREARLDALEVGRADLTLLPHAPHCARCTLS